MKDIRVWHYGWMRRLWRGVLVGFSGFAPERAHAADAGFDLRAEVGGWDERVRIDPGHCRRVNLRTRVDIPEGHFGLLCSRSGMGAEGVGLVNGVGIIDAGYHGKMAVNLCNHGECPYFVSDGDRVAQLLILPVPNVQMYDLGDAFGKLEASERGEGGFGSTGR